MNDWEIEVLKKEERQKLEYLCANFTKEEKDLYNEYANKIRKEKRTLNPSEYEGLYKDPRWTHGADIAINITNSLENFNEKFLPILKMTKVVYPLRDFN